MIPTLAGVSVIVFALTQAVPGGPVETIIRQMRQSQSETGGRASTVDENLRAALNRQFGYDKPPVTRYLHWAKDIIRLDFGTSHYYNEPVIDLIIRRFPVSLTFGIWSFIVIYAVSIPLGIFKAVHDGSRFDTISSIIIFTGYSIPSFGLAILLIVFLGGGNFLNLFPIMGLLSEYAHELNWFERVIDYLHHIILPIICYTVGSFASLTMLMKNSFIEQIHQDYVRTARAKGLTSRTVYFKHVLRNALIPIATGLGGFLGIFLTGSILLESIFGLEGIALLSYESLLSRDYPVVLAIIMIAAFAGVIGNLFSDILYVLINPRINFD